MKTHTLTMFAFALAVLGSWNVNSASAQDQRAVLAETYGQGVHAYNGGRLTEALEFFTLAIDNGTQDPRVYYFRGIVSYVSGRPEEAEKDWNSGAVTEALQGPNLSIGRSLSRFQGNGRLKLEQIRQTARFKALAEANARSRQRYGEIQSTPENSAVQPTPRLPAQPIAPPPTPPAASNPFAADSNLGQGNPEVIAEDALAGAMTDPFKNEPKAAAPAAGGAGGADPFGGGGAAGGAGGADPFGGGGAAGGADPFGGDPFGT